MLSPGANSCSSAPSSSRTVPRKTTKSSSESPCAYGSASGRAADVELAGEDLEVVERPRGQQHLPPENPERETRPVCAPQHPRLRRPAALEEIRDADAEPVGDAAQGRDARARPAALDLAQEALAEPRALGDLAQRPPSGGADEPKPLADVDIVRHGWGARGQARLSLRPHRRKLKRPYGTDEAESTRSAPGMLDAVSGRHPSPARGHAARTAQPIAHVCGASCCGSSLRS